MGSAVGRARVLSAPGSGAEVRPCGRARDAAPWWVAVAAVAPEDHAAGLSRSVGYAARQDFRDSAKTTLILTT
jgi:hypothetical protein